ncbi:MAG: hypothetical protein DWQ10_02415, partial [Calditrichaeota bacterium]
TPLAIARIVRTQGLQGNWYWWSGIMGFMLRMFFFARLWRRAKIITDAEFIELRYEGKPAATLRLFHAVYRSTLFNSITMGWVILGMQKLSVETFGWSKMTAIPLLIIICLVYTVLSGLWGVVITDFFQFVLAMSGSLILTFLVLDHVGGPTQLAEQVLASAANVTNGASAVAAPEQILNFIPDFTSGGLALFTFLMYIGVQWWGGGEGGGFLAQRLFSTKNERHAILALLWFSFAHFVLRTWPWIVVGLASVVFFPNLEDPEMAYPKMMVKFLPTGLKGLMVASFVAAFMSTITTHLNWGASYLMNDVYKRFIKKDASDRHYVLVSQLFVVAMAILAGIAAWQMNSIFSAWLYLTEIMAGTVFVVLLRWYWWRINAWSEISAMISSLLISNLFRLIKPVAALFDALHWPDAALLLHNLSFITADKYYPVRFLIVLFISTIIWITVTLRTRPVGDLHLIEFFKRVHPAMNGWQPIALKAGNYTGVQVGFLEISSWILSVFALFLALFGVGWIFLGNYSAGLLALGSALFFGWIMLRNISKMDWKGE